MKFNLPSSETSKLFETDTEATNFQKVLEQIDKEKMSIFRDLDKLEELYLIQNLAKLKDPAFRIYLLTHAFGNREFNNFCSKIGTTISKNSSNIEKQEFVNRISSFEWADNEKTRAFVSAFEFDEGIIPSPKDIEKDLEILEKPTSIYYPFFDYQSEIADKVKKQLSIPGGRAMVQIPTGGGKTKIGMEIVTDFLNDNTDATVVWLADKEELLDQAIVEFKKIWKHRATKSAYLNRVWSQYNIEPNISDSKLVVGGLSKLISFFKRGGKLKADLIIFDEAHHAAAEKYSEVLLNLVTPGSTNLLGLTATPGREGEGETEKLVQLFNTKPPIGIDTHDPHLSTIGYLQEKGVLAKLRVGGERIVSNPVLDVDFTETELKNLLKGSEYTDKSVLKKIGQSHLRNIIIGKKLLELNSEGRQVLYFGPSVEQAHQMYLLLKNFDVKAGLIIGDKTITPSEYRTDLISKFREKKINFLLNYDVLTTGFDAPVVDTVFIARPTKSQNTLFQMMGRGMRGPKVKDGTEFCDVYHIRDKFLERYQDFDYLYETYGDAWKNEQSSEE